MKLDGIFYPVLLCGMTAAGLSLSLYLFLTIKRELHSLDKHWAKRFRVLEEEIGEFRRNLADLRRDLKVIEDRGPEQALIPPPRSGMNLNKRSQVLRMSRRGETPELIAAALSLPQNEVDLLLKVHGAAGQN